MSDVFAHCNPPPASLPVSLPIPSHTHLCPPSPTPTPHPQPRTSVCPDDNTDGISPKSHLAHQDGTIYGLPADGAIGLTVSGQPMFPVFNNNAEYTPQKCEVDSCQEHVGQGGGAPHLHGDPFGDEQTTRCLYGPSNYSSTSQHPPIIGFSFDGHLIYGRHLTENDLGYTAPGLDACGGHSHTATGDVDEHGNSLGTYHYHAQIFAATVGRGNPATEGEAYLVSTPGPFQCFKADIEGAEGSSALLAAQASPLVVARDMTCVTIPPTPIRADFLPTRRSHHTCYVLSRGRGPAGTQPWMAQQPPRLAARSLSLTVPPGPQPPCV